MFGLNQASSTGSLIEELCQLEKVRQWKKLILIPSESICIPAVARVLSSGFTNLYAEGQPQPILCPDARTSALDGARFQSWQTRMADYRYYQGCLNVNRVELLARQYIAETFAALEDNPPPEQIYVAVQPLSGAPANLAVYHALIEPGDVILGLNLSHGGHLTHGSRVNFSGKTYQAYSYGIDPKTRRLNYDRIAEQAARVRPKLLIAGASAYPWDLDWRRLAQIAGQTGAMLMADIAHLSGMVAAGELNNPLPYADVVTFTTHKTLCGPRGAVILTTNPEIAKKLEDAVFPGLQGGPHINNIAAIARLFELILADRQGFKKLQRAILDNTAYFAHCLAEEGIPLEFGGTNTHLLLVDLKRFKARGSVPLDGGIAARLLELVGIVCNKNTIPGDVNEGFPTGIRMGMPWLTQRGITREQIKELTGIIKLVLGEARTTQVYVPGGKRCRARVPAPVLEEAAKRVSAIARALPYPPRPEEVSRHRQTSRLDGCLVLSLRGDKTTLALQQLLTCNLSGIQKGACRQGLFLESDGAVIAEATVCYEGRLGREDHYLLVVNQAKAERVRRWVSYLSDGYVLFDETDLQAKLDGPLVVEQLNPSEIDPALKDVIMKLEPSGEADARGARELLLSRPDLFDLHKTYFIGQKALYASVESQAKEPYHYKPEKLALRRTVLSNVHRKLGAKTVEFAGWEMPIHYPAGIFAEHRAVRSAAGLFDVSHMSIVEVSGRNALPFIETALSNCVSRLEPGQAQYSTMLRTDGSAIDDVFLYRTARDRFLLVLNAANAEEDIAWLEAINSRRYIIDADMTAKQVAEPVRIRNMRNAGKDSLVGLALQGPASRKLLQMLADRPEEQARVARLLQNRIIPIHLAHIPVLLSRTGYTGELVGFEIMVHPAEAEKLWSRILEAGKPAGVLPAGLGARDSIRIEAGLPLFGHELEGKEGLTPGDIDYGFIVRFHRPFFVGRRAHMERTRQRTRRLLRLRGRGRKTVRVGHTIVDEKGSAVGIITSFAYVSSELDFFVLAAVDVAFAPAPGKKVLGVRVNRTDYHPPAQPRSLVELVALTRFPEEEERTGWQQSYLNHT